jgi:M3 family oligoendopeptidase
MPSTPSQQFKEFHYERPDFQQFSASFKTQLAVFVNADTFEAQDKALSVINAMRSRFMSMYNLCFIRHTLDTRDAFYEQENEYFDHQMPAYESLVNQFYKQLLKASFRPALEKKWGQQLFNIAELSLKAFDDAVIHLLQEENKLSSAYTKLKGNAKIMFNGEEHNLSSIIKFESDKDEQVRKAAAVAKWAFYEENKNEIESIFDKLVKTRHQVATSLGFDNFVALGYTRMLRADYDAAMVARFRKQVLDKIVPIATGLYERQRKRLGLKQMRYYDENLRFLTGNPEPKGATHWIVAQAERMYRELSAETDEFFQFMKTTGLMDLEAKAGKAPGGYCTYISNYQAPYIFSNFNGTSGDIDVLTHEAGHAFQVFSSRALGISEYNWPTYEACEIHSMSMELFTWPWMELFFKEETEKFKYSQLTAALSFLPYSAAVDEFQHFVYANPEVSPEDRNAAWRALEKKYLPHRNYEDNTFLEQGRFWQKQSHIFSAPFYYIDYALAQICAFQFWKKDQDDHESAWKDYLHLCKLGGKHSFLELVQQANLRSPFEEEGFTASISKITDWLEQVDDSGF